MRSARNRQQFRSRLAGLVGVLVLLTLLLAACGGAGASPDTFTYVVIVAGDEPGQRIENAMVTLAIQNQPPIVEYTDANGYVGFPLAIGYNGQSARLIVETQDFNVHRETITLSYGTLPKDIRLTPNGDTSDGDTPPAPTPTDTPAPTDDTVAVQPTEPPTPVPPTPVPPTPIPPTHTPVPPTHTPTRPSRPPTSTPVPLPPTNPLYPVTVQEWRDSMANPITELTREGDHYWRYVPAGTYTIGGWLDDDDDDNDAQADVTLSDYWVAKHPVTVEQYRVFIEAGGYDNESYWTPEGWTWRQEYNRTSPNYWPDDEGRFNVEDEQPVVGVSWYEATAFAAWLNAQLADVLPDDTCIRLPTEAEWEAACAYDTAGQRHTYPWGDTPEPDSTLADFGKDWETDAPASVGGRPDGAAACGAQDMAGSVWEWTTSSYGSYAEGSGSVQGDFRTDERVPMRGRSWHNSSTSVRCGSRHWGYPGGRNYYRGFRVFRPSHICSDF